MLFKLGPLRLKQFFCHTATWPKIHISSWNETSRNFDRENYLLRILDLNQWHHRSSWTTKTNHDVHYQSPLSRLHWNHLWEEKLRPHSYNLTLKIPSARLWVSGATLPMPWHPQMWQTLQLRILNLIQRHKYTYIKYCCISWLTFFLDILQQFVGSMSSVSSPLPLWWEEAPNPPIAATILTFSITNLYYKPWRIQKIHIRYITKTQNLIGFEYA